MNKLIILGIRTGNDSMISASKTMKNIQMNYLEVCPHSRTLLDGDLSLLC